MQQLILQNISESHADAVCITSRKLCL